MGDIDYSHGGNIEDIPVWLRPTYKFRRSCDGKIIECLDEDQARVCFGCSLGCVLDRTRGGRCDGAVCINPPLKEMVKDTHSQALSEFEEVDDDDFSDLIPTDVPMSNFVSNRGMENRCSKNKKKESDFVMPRVNKSAKVSKVLEVDERVLSVRKEMNEIIEKRSLKEKDYSEIIKNFADDIKVWRESRVGWNVICKVLTKNGFPISGRTIQRIFEDKKS